ncbi:hypothetical protein WJX74_003537 [Apatococcus lobatus]|uniref:1-alkyl-2-acetylglycerophosphocholine esterase n=1 Tax=Apatococcus lobatus TaxID=904363 RepID=A0AAW1QUA6_9CHLO
MAERSSNSLTQKKLKLQHSVGVTDIQWDNPDQAQISGDTHVVGRLWYPTTAMSSVSKPEGGKAFWLPDRRYAEGYAAVVFSDNGIGPTVGSCKNFAKSTFSNFTWWMGSSTQLKVIKDVPLKPAQHPYPVVLFSHGTCANRNTYSCICTKLAEEGYVVFSIEHADSTASAVEMAGDRGWQVYAGETREHVHKEFLRYRMKECQTARKMVAALSSGTVPPGVQLTVGKGRTSGPEKGPEPGPLLRQSFKGALDPDRVALAGHSFGASTVSALVAEDPGFPCAIALDPAWALLWADHPALTAWKTSAPLMIIGSHQWHTPKKDGTLVRSGHLQETVLAAASRRQLSIEDGKVEGSAAGGGAVSVVPAGSTHETFTDALVLFAGKTSWLLKMMGLGSGLNPKLGLKLTCEEMLAFLKRHIPEAGSSVSTISSSQKVNGLSKQVATVPLQQEEDAVYKSILGDKCALFKMRT